MRLWPLLLALVACSSDEDPAQVCAPGRQEACACPGGGQGAQVCNTEGTGYGACAPCDANAGGSGGGGGEAGAPDCGTKGESCEKRACCFGFSCSTVEKTCR